MATINRDQIPDTLAALQTGVATSEYEFDFSKEPEVITEKQAVKLLPCTKCKRPMATNAFYAAAKAICSECRGETGTNGVASVGQPVPGVTDPAKAVDLTKTLVNSTFAQALCPVHPEDPEHEMLLVNVSHNDYYGPSEFVGYGKNGMPEYRQTDKGETVRHQCQRCRAVVTYSTTHQTFVRPINEPKTDHDLGHRPGVYGFNVETLNGDIRTEKL